MVVQRLVALVAVAALVRTHLHIAVEKYSEYSNLLLVCSSICSSWSVSPAVPLWQNVSHISNKEEVIHARIEVDLLIFDLPHT